MENPRKSKIIPFEVDQKIKWERGIEEIKVLIEDMEERIGEVYGKRKDLISQLANLVHRPRDVNKGEEQELRDKIDRLQEIEDGYFKLMDDLKAEILALNKRLEEYNR